MFDKIDAVLRPRNDADNITPNQRNMFYSVRITTPSCAGAGRTFRLSDVGRILPDGDLEYFITTLQVASFFGLTEPFSIDAVALDLDPEWGGLYLSFGRTETIDTLLHSATTVRDGAISAVIGDPEAGRGWFIQPLDGGTTAGRA